LRKAGKRDLPPSMENNTALKGIITQVPREESGQSSLITSADANSTPRIQVESDEVKEKRTNSWFRKLCCCFFRNRGEGYRSQDSALEVPLSDGTPLLPPPSPDLTGRKCLVLDLDETLLHSSFKPIPNPDFIIPVEIEDQVHKVYVLKRPGVDEFLRRLGDQFELVVFTASLSKYADPVLDLLDSHRVVKSRLFREACSNYKGNFVKDLSRLGREMKAVAIIDNSPSSYLFHPENAIPVETWYDNEKDTELLDLLPVLEQLSKSDNVVTFLANCRKNGQFPIRHQNAPNQYVSS